VTIGMEEARRPEKKITVTLTVDSVTIPFEASRREVRKRCEDETDVDEDPNRMYIFHRTAGLYGQQAIPVWGTEARR